MIFSSMARTVGIVAPVEAVAQPKLTMEVAAPALDGCVVLRRGAIEDHCLVKHRRIGRVFH